MYRLEINIREEWKGKSLYLRFESVNGYARFYIDGVFIGEHWNSFLALGFDITEHTQGKKSVTLTVTVDEKADKVGSFASGGILRGAALYVLPEIYCSAVHIDTFLESPYEKAFVRIRYALSGYTEDVRVQAELLCPAGKKAADAILNKIEKKSLYGEGGITVDKALLWDAEHPRLYTVNISLEKEGALLEKFSLRIGLRQIERRVNRLYVNGREVKLRGVCRHETSAQGRCLSPEIIRRDIELFKEANCNYIRTSHYPPSEYFLDLCDEKGIYVEDELPMAFIARTLDFTQRDPAHSERYIGTFNEIYARDGNHPSVLIWSLCNESFGGYNFDLMNRQAKKIDPSRPTKFSYPMTMREEHLPVDIWSVHYANIDSDLGSKMDNVSVAGAPGKDTPVIHDEYAHVPCYDREEFRRDPNIRSYWGESLALFWRRIWDTEGALGGAIWAGIDETDIFYGGSTRLEWGIIDIWRRKKPEHYMTRKAYSPVQAALSGCNDDSITITIENRFCHTNLAETGLRWKYGGNHGELKGPPAGPREKASIALPLKPAVGVPLELSIDDSQGLCVDEYLFVPLPALPVKAPVKTSSAPLLEADSSSFLIRGGDFELRFSRVSGLLEYGKAAGETILAGGPYLHAPYFKLGPWKLRDIGAETENDTVKVSIRGVYEGSAEISFILVIRSGGGIDVSYTIEKLLRNLPHAEKLRVGTDCGGLDELGAAFTAVSGMDTLTWKRKGFHSWYPEDHISRNEGKASRFSRGGVYGEEPAISWGEETQNWILNGKYDVDYRGTNDFRSLKANITEAALYKNGGKARLAAASGGDHSLRIEAEEPEELLIHADDPRLRYRGAWFRQEDFRGSLKGIEMWSAEKGAACECGFEGTGIVWYGPVDTVYGIAKVYLDGTLVDGNLSQLVAGVDFPGSAAGYDKKYNYPVYSAGNLPEGKHTLRIEAAGEKGSSQGSGYIVIDHFRILRKKGEENLRFIVLNDYNYPHIAWGNKSRPAITPGDGYANSVSIRIEKQNEGSA
jgi:hypothetical protein